jgi:hypothetical protein
MSDSTQDMLEAVAKLRVKAGGIGMPNPADPLQAAMQGTNIGMPGSPFRQAPMYRVPGKFNVSGWTNPKTHETFITDTSGGQRMANTISHEQFHAAMGRGMPLPPESNMPLAEAARAQLARNMDEIQPASSLTGTHWGLLPNRNAEEQIANLRGYEGALPAGTPITASPFASRLFKGVEGITPQQLKDYYFGQSSLAVARNSQGVPVGKGVWEGQVPMSSVLDRLSASAKRVATQLGISTERFNKPNE